MKKKEKRFSAEDAGSGNGLYYTVATDQVTGVQYLCAANMTGALAITPLLNRDGMPLIAETAEER